MTKIIMHHNQTYRIHVHEAEQDEGKGFWISVPTLPGCFSRGDTYDEVIKNAREAIACQVEGIGTEEEILLEPVLV